MAAPLILDYGLTRNERLFVVPETTFNVLAKPNAFGAKAAVTIDPAGTNNKLDWAAISNGVWGNALNVRYVDPGPGHGTTDATVAYVGGVLTVTITLKTDGGGVILTIANDIIAAVAADPATADLVTVANHAPDDGTGVVTAITSTPFTGGVDDRQDNVPILPGMTLPSAIREFTPTIERTGTAGVPTLIRRKKKPSNWKIPVYSAFADSPGTPPKFRSLMAKGMGSETITPGTKASLTTALTGANNDLTFGAIRDGLQGNKISIEYVDDGSTTQTLKVTVTQKAISIRLAKVASAISTIASDIQHAIRTDAVASKMVNAYNAAGNSGVGLVTALAKTFLSGGLDNGKVEYDLITTTTESSVSLWHWVDNMMRGFRGCVVSMITTELQGSTEPKITFDGFASNEVWAGTSSIKTSHPIASGDTVPFNLFLPAGEAARYQVGRLASDSIYIQIDDEIFLVAPSADFADDGVDYDADTLRISARAQLGTSAADHAALAVVQPWQPARDANEADVITGVALGEIDLGSVVSMRVIMATQIINMNYEPRIDEYAQDTLTGYRPRGKRQVTGQIRMYARKENESFISHLERGFEVVGTFKAGKAGIGFAVATWNMPRFRFRNMTVDSGGDEFMITGEYQALESLSPANDETTLVTG